MAVSSSQGMTRNQDAGGCQGQPWARPEGMGTSGSTAEALMALPVTNRHPPGSAQAAALPVLCRHFLSTSGCLQLCPECHLCWMAQRSRGAGGVNRRCSEGKTQVPEGIVTLWRVLLAPWCPGTAPHRRGHPSCHGPSWKETLLLLLLES